METNEDYSSFVEEGDVNVNNTAAAATKEQVPELTAELVHSVFSNRVVSSYASYTTNLASSKCDEIVT